jgi:hypothetical protein
MRRERRAANIRKMKQKKPNVEIQIDELILRGFPAADRYAIGDALSQELSQLVSHAAPDAFAREIDLPSYRAGEISLPPQARPDTIGANVAQTVHAGLTTIHPRGQP